VALAGEVLLSSDLPDGWFIHGQRLIPGSAVLFDLDGVLSDAGSRQAYLRGPVKDWRGFFDACAEDEPIEEMVRLAECIDPALQIVLLTGRPVRVANQTIAWLERKAIRWDLLIMHPPGRPGPVASFKRAAVEELSQKGFDCRLAFEDDPRNREAFLEAGVPCVYVHSGYYEGLVPPPSRVRGE
jgi:beta-phosphoglucomutase-like phosphatase (HAD superfamily)